LKQRDFADLRVTVMTTARENEADTGDELEVPVPPGNE